MGKVVVANKNISEWMSYIQLLDIDFTRLLVDGCRETVGGKPTWNLPPDRT